MTWNISSFWFLQSLHFVGTVWSFVLLLMVAMVAISCSWSAAAYPSRCDERPVFIHSLVALRSISCCSSIFLNK